MKERFAKLSDEYIQFERIPAPLHPRPDICAFLLLDRLCPGNRDLIIGAMHETIFLDINLEQLARVASDDDILTLVRCGVRCTVEGLEMYV